MKKFLSVVGGLFLVLVLALFFLFGVAAYQGRGLDASSKAYVEENIPIISSNWSESAILERASPQLLKILNEKPELLHQLLKKLSKLGSMKNFTELKGQSNVSYTTQEGKVITAEYFGRAAFENGEGQVTVRLIKTDDKWQLLLFNVNSSLFLN